MRCFFLLCCLMAASACSAGTAKESRQEAEYYVAAYARHYNMPVEFVRAVVEQESGWKRCVISSKGAVGLMQLMPATAVRLKVIDRCNIRQNISGGVRYLAWLAAKFHRDLRLVAAAYYVGEHAIAMRGLNYANPDVVAYVASIHERIERQRKLRARIFRVLAGGHNESDSNHFSVRWHWTSAGEQSYSHNNNSGD